ncbi:MAG: ATP-dependent DNA helicase PcrA [Firmicutes bacterium]|nr:ATP-dependent DNA helicase PcrA [Bacillota bacterium]
MQKIEQELNQQQLAAVCHSDGPLLIIAGAGSGKTRVLTYRIARLLETGVARPSEILAITFTNKAATEMRERVEALVGNTDGMWISTFHSACVRMLRRHGQKAGYQPGFSIYDDQDQLTVVKQCLRELELDDKKFVPRAVLSAISNAKNQLMGPDEYSKQATDWYREKVATVYKLYQRKLQANNALDFDDLLVVTVNLLENHQEVREQYQERFRYIHVDEYQDTNHAQYKIVNLLASAHRNICVVGDDDQSIYLFRGADVGNILDFEKDYPEATVIKLEQNYRSTGNILGAANSIISHNNQRKQKELWTAAGDGAEVSVYNAQTETDEAGYVVHTIQSGQRPLSDYAVLYRTRAQSRTLEDALRRANIPYQLVGGVPFYGRKEIKDMLAYLKLLVNPWDSTSLARVINEPRRGIGQKTLEKLLALAAEKGVAPALYLAEAAEKIGGKSGSALAGFANLMKELDIIAGQSAVTITLQEIMQRTGYTSLLTAENTVEAHSRLENLQELLTVTEEYDRRVGGDLVLFLEEISLVSDLDSFENDSEGVTLITLHSAKGLEFPAVFLVGLEEGLFPHSRCLEDESQLQEERRLCYVGMTRAMEELCLIWARTRHIFGRHISSRPSRFLREVDDKFLRYVNGSPQQIQEWAGAAAESATAATVRHDFTVGMVVNHRQWGKGTVVAMETLGSQQVIIVDFPGQGRRKLMAEYAPLTPCED